MPAHDPRPGTVGRHESASNDAWPTLAGRAAVADGYGRRP